MKKYMEGMPCCVGLTLLIQNTNMLYYLLNGGENPRRQGEGIVLYVLGGGECLKDCDVFPWDFIL